MYTRTVGVRSFPRTPSLLETLSHPVTLKFVSLSSENRVRLSCSYNCTSHTDALTHRGAGQNLMNGQSAVGLEMMGFTVKTLKAPPYLENESLSVEWNLQRVDRVALVLA